MADKPKRRTNKDKIKLRYSGMKVLPKIGRPKGYKVPYKPLTTYQGKVKTGQSEWKKRSNAEFLKVREGETLEQWRKRTIHRRVRDVDEILELKLTNPLRINLRNRERNRIDQRNKFIRVQCVEREFDFLRYYGIVVNYFSIKFGIRVEDIQIGFYFYSNIPFTKERFDNAAVLHYGTSLWKHNRAIKEGLIVELIQTIKHYNKENTYKKTSLYQLTPGFLLQLNDIYRTIGKMNTIQLKQPIFSGLSPEIMQIMKDMNDDILDIQTGRKPHEKIN